MTDELDQPVRRYFDHALTAQAARASRGVRLRMDGRIKAGRRLRFAADWQGDGRSFEWRARAGLGPLRPLRVVDRYAGGRAAMDVRLSPGLRLVHADDEDTLRSAAGRTAVEAAIWAPMALLPERGVTWRAESDELIVASWDVAPERPEVHIGLGPGGSVRSAWLERWDNGAHGRHGYIPCGCEVRSEQRFGDIVIAADVLVGWWFDTARWDPFFEARVTGAVAFG